MLRTILLWVPMALALALHAQSPTIRGYEYWFNQNDALPNRVFVPLTPPATTMNLSNVALPTSDLPVGTHMVHLRLKDHASDGAVRWSSVVTRTFQKFQPGPWEIVAVRYWVGTPANEFDPLVRTKFFDSPQQQINYTGPLDLCGYPIGSQMLQLQLKDNHGQWSSVVSRNVSVVTAGTLGLPTIAASPVQNSFCPGAVVTFVATPPSGGNNALPGAYTWIVPTSAGWSHVPSTSDTITVTVGNSGGPLQVFSSNFCDTSATASFPVNIPAVPAQPSVVQGSSACAGSLTSFAVDPVSGVTFQWSVPGGTPSTGTGTTFSTTLTANATITVTPVNSCGVPGQDRTAPITVSQPSNAGTNGTLTTCSSLAAQSLFAQLGGTPSTGGSWSGPSTVVGGQYNPAAMVPGVYTYTVTGTAPCLNATATVIVVENGAPNAGGSATLSVCSNGASVSLLALLGGTPSDSGTWSGESPVVGGQYNPATMLPGVYTYTVNGTAPCVNATATVTVSETNAPNAGTNGTLTLCQSSAPSDLLLALGSNAQASGTWSGPTATEGVFDPTTMLAGTYTYTVAGNGPCANASATVTVAVNALPNAGSDGLLAICDNAAPIALFPQLGGTPQAGGTWTPSLPGGIYDPALLNAGTYTYTVPGTAPCPDAAATVTVSETVAPNAGGNGALTVCDNAPPASLFNALDGTPDTTGTWSPGPVSGGQFDPATMIAGPYTYTVSGTAPCSNATATVLVSIPALDLTAVTGPTGLPVVEPTTYTAAPQLADADSILWTLPAGWDWDVSDGNIYNETAILLPPDTASIYTICARAVGSGCSGAEVCSDSVNVTVGIVSLTGTGPMVVAVYPNPSRGLFTVDFDTDGGEALHFEVRDLSGRTLTPISRQYARFDMDLSHLASGTYLLQWSNSSGMGHLPLVLQR